MIFFLLRIQCALIIMQVNARRLPHRLGYHTAAQSRDDSWVDVDMVF